MHTQGLPMGMACSGSGMNMLPVDDTGAPNLLFGSIQLMMPACPAHSKVCTASGKVIQPMPCWGACFSKSRLPHLLKPANRLVCFQCSGNEVDRQLASVSAAAATAQRPSANGAAVHRYSGATSATNTPAALAHSRGLLPHKSSHMFLGLPVSPSSQSS